MYPYKGPTFQDQAYLTAELVTAATTEPLSLSESKKQVEVADSDSAHDDHLWRLIQTAREQFEHDTDSALCFQTWRCKFERIYDGLVLPKRPINSITSITYYNTLNSSTTLSSSVYQLEAPKKQIRLAYLQSWPDTVSRWDAITVTYKLGYSADGRSVPSIAKQAMLLLVGHYFENRDMIESLPGGGPSDAVPFAGLRAYEALVARYMRSSYP